jgi:hypothetical protein
MKILCTSLLLLTALPAFAVPQTANFTHPLTPELRTLKCIIDDDFQRPVLLDMEGQSTMEISFDILADEERRVSYRVVHCTAQWEDSPISELDYIEGFQPTRVGSVEPSFNTNVSYYHYRISYPNDDFRLLISGNYAVHFFYDDEPDRDIAIATFRLTEQQVAIGGEVSGNTDVDFRQAHQQLTCNVSWSTRTFPNMDPASDLTLMVRQNGRRDTQRRITRPSRITAGQAYYEHNTDLIFPAGNNFRRFEFTDEHYTTIGVDHVVYRAPYYEAWLTPGRVRPQAPYQYDSDQNGRFLTHALRVNDPETESDYFLAEFQLESMPIALGGRDIFLYGDFTYGIRDASTRLEYDPELNVYHQNHLLKQGAYNYLYLVGTAEESQSEEDTRSAYPEEISPLRTAPIEGDHYETPNEYDISVYYRPVGARYDRLIGVATVFSSY